MGTVFWEAIRTMQPLMDELKASEELNWDACTKAPK